MSATITFDHHRNVHTVCLDDVAVGTVHQTVSGWFAKPAGHSRYLGTEWSQFLYPTADAAGIALLDPR